MRAVIDQANGKTGSCWRIARLSVRGLLGIVLVTGAALGWVVHRAHVQRNAVAAIRGAGGTVDYKGPWTNREPDPNCAARWVQSVVEYLGVDYVDTVSKVDISGGWGSDTELVEIGDLTSLKELSASGSPRVTDAGLTYISRLTRLRVLKLHSTEISDAGLASLSGLRNLQSLAIDATRVSDAGLACLSGLSNLEVLGLRNNEQVSDAGLAHLRCFTKLKSLLLDGTNVTDAGLAHLEGLSKLEVLLLDGTAVSDAGLAHLSGLANLRFVLVRNSRVSDAGVRHLQQALPNARIAR
jgi:hypothetical protein